MAETYKGLIIKFGADTTELDEKLKGIQKESKKTYSDLKDINKSLKFNPGNTELLEQKTRALSDVIKQTKDRLNAYRDALSELEAKKQNGATLTEREQRQYEQLQRDILKCEGQLKSYGKQLGNTKTEAEASQTGLYKVGQTLQDNADKLGEHGKRMESAGKVMTGVSVAVGGAAIAAFNEVDAGMDAAVKATGATGDAAKALGESVKNVAGTVAGSKLSWEQLGSAVGEVSTRFGFSGQQLDTCTEDFAKFADVTGMDATEAVRLVSRAMGDAGIESTEYGTVLDSLTAASQASGISIDKLTENLTKYGAPMRALGFDTQSAIAIFSQWEKAGVNTEIAFSGMKKAISNWAKEGKDAKVEFGNMLQEIANCPDIASATTKAIEVFGAKAGPDLADAIQNGRFEYSDFMQLLENSKGTLSSTFDETVDGVDNANVAFKEMQAAGSELGGALSEVAGPILHDFAGLIHGIAEAFKSLSPEQQDFIAKMVIATAGAGMLTTGLGNLLQSAGAIGGALKQASTLITSAKGALDGLSIGTKLAEGATTAFSGALSFLAANPIVLVIAAIAALVAGLVWFFTQTEQGRELWGKFVDFITTKWQQFTSWFGEKVEAVKGFFDNLGKKVGEIRDFWGKKFDEMHKGVSDWADGVKSKWDEVKRNAGDAFGAVSTIVSRDMRDAQSAGSNAASAIQRALSGDFDGAARDAQNAFSTISRNINDKMGWARDGAINAANWIGDKLGFPGLGTNVWNTFEAIRQNMTNPIQSAVDWISGIPERVISWFWGLGDRISNAFGSIHFPSPHVSWGGITIGDWNLPLPYVDWWASGGIFTKPTLLGGGNGVGEAGPEAVLPIERLSDLMAKAIEQVTPTGLMTAPTITVNVTAQVGSNLDAYALGQQIGRGVNSTLRQQGVA